MGKPESTGKTPTKAPAKDIRSFFAKKQDGGAGGPKPSPAVPKSEKLPAPAPAPVPPKATAPLQPTQQAKQIQPPQSTQPQPAKQLAAGVRSAERKATPKKAKATPEPEVVDDDDDDDVVMVQQPPAGGKDAKRGGGRGSEAGPRKKRRVITDVDEEDAVVVASESSDDDDADFVEEESSDSDLADLVDSDEDDMEGGAGGGKRKGKAGAKRGSQLASQPAKLAGTKHARSPVAPKPAAPTPKVASAAKAAAAKPSAVPEAAAASKKGTPASRVSAAIAAAPASGKKSAAKKGPAAFSMDSKAGAAIAAVAQAASKLPAEEEVNFSLMPEGGEAAGNDTTQPPNYRNKEVPRGHPDCLTGSTFVITGVLDSLMRPEAEDLVKRHGGKVTQNVSGKTSFLVAGHNCGRSKYRTARQHGTKLIDEDGLFALIRASAPFAPEDQPPLSQPAPAAGGASAAGPATIATSKFMGPTAGTPALPSVPRGPAVAGQAGPSGSRPAGGGGGGGGLRLNQLWVDKYKPLNSSELVGNNTLVATLMQWLRSWDEVHLRGGAAPAAKGGGSKPKDLTKKAALLSGPPGIGKTSAAHILAREAGFDVVEMNASDTRNKSGKVSDGMAGKQSNIIKEMVSNTTLPGLGAARKQLLIMDEVDGMSGGDRGGIQDLIDTIKRSKIPIICICNDKYNQKLRSLRNHCMELEFRKPSVQQIAKRMSEICQKEGLQVNQATMDALVAGAGGDLRLILGQLQMVRLRAQALTYDEVKGKLGTSKDTDMSPFECGRRLLEPAAGLLSMGDRLDLVFADIDLVPLLVQENYVNHRPTIAPDPVARLRALAKASDSISAGDVVSNVLRRSQNWGLMPFAAIMSSVLPATYMRGPREVFGLYPGEMNFPRFTAWLGSYSSSNKQRRLLGELSTTMAASGRISSSRSAVRLEYASALRHLLVRPLVLEQEAAVPAVVEMMHGYCIDREQLDYIMDVTSFKSKAPWAEDLYKEVPTKVKSAFTRSLNSTAPAARCNAQVDEVKLGRGAGKGKAAKARKAADDEDDEAALGDGLEQEQANGAAQRAGEGAPVEQQEEDEDLDPATLARRLAKDGLVIQLQDDGKGKGKKGAAAAGRGGGGRGWAAKAAGGGRGRGGGKTAAKK